MWMPSRCAMHSSPPVPKRVPDDRRLHPASWVFEAARATRHLLLPLLVVLFASGGASYEFWTALVLVPAVGASIMQYCVFRYRLDPEELVVRTGIFARSERHIPYDRIQNIDLVQNPLHRWLDVAVVRIETASGGTPEAVIRVLSQAAIDEMRQQVFARRSRTGPAPEAPESATDPLLRLSAGEIVRLGIVSNKGLVVAGAAIGLIWQLSRSWTSDPEALAAIVEPYLGDVPMGLDGVAGISPAGLTVLALLALTVAVVALRGLSICWYLIQLHEFSVAKRGEELRVNYGLVTRLTRTIPTPHIQTFTALATPLHRWFRRTTVEVRTIGTSSATIDGDGATRTQHQWLAPMLPTDRMPVLVRQVFPEITFETLAWNSLAPGARRRILRRGLFWAAIATGGTALVLGPVLLVLGAALSATIWAVVHARNYVAHTGYAVADWGVAIKRGWWTRTMTLVRFGTIQAVVRYETPFDRRHGMAAVRVDTAAAPGSFRTLTVPYLDRSTAADLAGLLARRARRHAFRLRVQSR